MAQRRMFNKTITNSSVFLKMPSSSRLLYYDLGMNADDDGYVEHYMVLKMTGASQQDLGVLEANGLVKVFDENVLWIKDWKENNYIQKDRYVPSKYLAIYSVDTLCIQDVYTGKDSIGKERLGEDRKGKKVVPAYYPNDEKLNAAFTDYVDMRKKIKAPMTDRAVTLAMNKLAELSGGDNDLAIEIVNQSIMNSWKGLFELKKTNKPSGNSLDDWANA